MIIGWTKDFYYESSSNRLDRHSDPGSSEYTYDEHGNLIDGTNIIGLTYNENDQIVEADLSGGGAAYYRYDSGGERIRKVVINGVNKKERLYLNNFEIYRESISGSVDLERETVYANDDQKRFLQLDTLTKDNGNPIGTPTTEWRYQFDNNIGSACLELDDTAAIISYEEYFPFGASSYRSGKSEAEVKRKRFRYTGKERDEETGLYYYGARYYAPWLCRFISCDPLGMVDAPSLYAYVRNNPIKLTDPDGMQAGGEDEEKEMQQEENTELKKYKTPSGATLITDGVSNPFFAGDITAETTAKDSEGNVLEVDVVRGSLLAFTFEGERYTARFGTSSGKFTRYANQKGESFEYGIDTDRLQSIDITFSELNSDHGILSGYMEIAENLDVLFGGKKFFFSAPIDGFDTKALGISLSGESSTELKGKLFFEDNLQDFRNLLNNIEFGLSEQSVSTPIKLFGSAEAGMLTIKGSKDFTTVFYGTNYKISLSKGGSLNPTPVDFSSRKGKANIFKLITPITRQDSIDHGLK